MVGAMIAMIRIQMNFQITPMGPKIMSKMVHKPPAIDLLVGLWT
jgi:hypothetical protein